MSATFAADPASPGKFAVTLAEDVANTNDSLTLRVFSGQLQYSLNGASFTNDLNSASPGVQALSIFAISQVNVQLLGGNDALRLDFSTGNVIPAFGSINYNGGSGSDSITASTDANFTLTNTRLSISSLGDVNLSGVESADLTGGNSANRIDASAFTAGSVKLNGGSQDDTIIGSQGNDTLVASQGRDLIDGRGGNDLMFSGTSGGTLYGGEGNDTLIGDNGKDALYGGAGNDLLLGNNGVDSLFGEAGNDSLDGGSANDELAGGSGTDTVQATANLNFLLTPTSLSGEGTDSLNSIEAANLTGGSGNNTLDASAFPGSVTLDGGGGTDVLIGGSGANNFVNNQGGQTTIVGGAGTNAFNLTPSGFVSLVDSGGDDDLNFSTASTGITIDLTQSGGTGQNVDGVGFVVALTGTFENVTGTSFQDKVVGNDANNLIFGGLGIDEIIGGGGDDIIFGGTSTTLGGTADADSSNDIIFGGLGIDQIDGGSGDDIIFGGTSTTLGGATDVDSSNDLIFGGIGTDQIDGGRGDDIIFGGTASGANDADTGNDLIFGGLGIDQIDGGGGDDIIFGGTNSTLGGTADADASNDIIFGGIGTDQIDGGRGDDIIFGGTAKGAADLDSDITRSNDVIFGGLGIDQIDGGRGDDIIFGGTGGVLTATTDTDSSNDLIFGGIGADQIDGGGGDDIIFGGTASGASDVDTDIAQSNDIIYGGIGSDQIDGGAGDDIIFGGTGRGAADLDSDVSKSNDVIYGGLGIDQIDGGRGDDIIFGGTSKGATDLDSDITKSNDIIFGGIGNDQIDGGGGDDIIFGGTGKGATDIDSEINRSNDVIYGGIGNDDLDGGGGDDIIFGGTGKGVADIDSDVTKSNDIIFGGSGSDVLVGGFGNDTLAGSTGNDIYLFIGSDVGTDAISEDSALDSDTLDFSAFDSAVTVDLALTSLQVVAAGKLSLQFSTDSGIENVIGSRFADTVYGNSRDNGLFGADQLDDRLTNPQPWTSTTQVVYLDFDSSQSVLVADDHVYTPAERDAIQSMIEEDYASFQVQVTQTVPTSGPYVTLLFNETPIVNGNPQPGGIADDLDFRNVNLSGTAFIDINTFLGGINEPAATSENYIRLSATVASHELGHLVGLRHLDASSPVGFGVPATIAPTRFLPAYPGPSRAFETSLHLMATPASVGSTLFDAVSDPFFGEREATKLSFNLSGVVIAEQQGAHSTRTSAQPLTLSTLYIPNTLRNGLNFGKDFAAAAVAVTGSVALVNGVSQDDYYSFTGRAGDVLNIELMSGSLTRIDNAIDSILRVFDSTGNEIAYYDSTAVNDDELEGRDSVLVDLILPADGMFYVQVDTFTDDSLGVPDDDTGDYELFMYRFDAGNATDAGDTLVGRGGNDHIDAGIGDDTLIGGTGSNTLIGGTGTDRLIDSGDVNFTLSDTALTGSGSNTLSGIEQASLTGGAGASTIRLTGWSGTTIIDGAGGIDTLVGANVTSIWTLSATGTGNINNTTTFAGVENFSGGTAADTLNWLNTTNTWNLTGVNAGNVGGSVFTGMENLGGGSADDAFTFALGGSVSGRISAGTGVNILNYAALSTPVTVNLTTGVATGTGGISGFQNVFGGLGNDSLTGNALANILVGNAGNDTLFGNAGRDILIGGLGSDLLDGGDDDDILIGARTVYDANPFALNAISAEWVRNDVTYAVRRDRISGAATGGLNGAFVFNSSTVIDDSRAPDTLWGRGGLDWFIFGQRDNLMDNTNTETTTRI